MKFINFITEAFYWLQIFLSPTLIGGLIAFIVYHKIPGTAGMVLTVAIGFCGAGLGVYFAERIRRKTGCAIFMSSLIATDNSDKKI